MALLLLAAAQVSAQGSTASSSVVSSSATRSSSSSSSRAPAASSSSSSSAAAATSSAFATASSNFTLPAGAATATWPSGLVLQSSVPYSMPEVDLKELNLPASLANYHLANETATNRQAICDRQTRWCATAGCIETGATVKENFCDADTLATRCTCSKGASSLQQYAWPVQVADCQNRASACTQLCWEPSTQLSDRNTCINNCSKNLRATCSTPGQVSANYAVSKRGDKPSYAMIQGGTANGASSGVLPHFAAVAVAASLVAGLATSSLVL